MYKLQHHPGLAARWQTFSQTQQIYMIANELNRALNARRQDDFVNVKAALENAFELIDLMAEYFRGGRQKELLRFREILGNCYLKPEAFSLDDLRKLCLVFLAFDSNAFNTLAVQYL